VGTLVAVRSAAVLALRWWVAVVLDHYSRRAVGFAVFRKEPSAREICRMLDRAVKRVGQAPKYTITDQGTQFGERYEEWCRRRGVKPRFGAVGKRGSIAVVERFHRTLKEELLRGVLVPYATKEIRRALTVGFRWYNEHRPHMALQGRAPREAYEGVSERPGDPTQGKEAGRAQENSVRLERGTAMKGPAREVRLHIAYFEGRRYLPVVRLEPAA